MIINSFGDILSGFYHFFKFLMQNGYCHSSSEKYAKMVLFGLKTHFKKFFLGYFYPLTLPMQKNLVKMVPKQVIQGGFKSPHPTHCQFQRPLLVGLINNTNSIKFSYWDSLQCSDATEIQILKFNLFKGTCRLKFKSILHC